MLSCAVPCETSQRVTVRPRAARAPDVRVPRLVRSSILAQHRAIEELLASIERLLSAAGRGEPFASFVGRELATLTGELGSELRAHLSYENRFLLATLRSIDGGCERAEQVYAEHREQRDRIDGLMRRLCTPSTSDAELMAAMRAFVRELRADMAREERGILAEPAFRANAIEPCEPAHGPLCGGTTAGARTLQ